MVAHGALSMWYQVSAHLQELSDFLTSLYQGAQSPSNLFYHQGFLNPLPHPAANLETWESSFTVFSATGKAHA